MVFNWSGFVLFVVGVVCTDLLYASDPSAPFAASKRERNIFLRPCKTELLQASSSDAPKEIPSSSTDTVTMREEIDFVLPLTLSSPRKKLAMINDEIVSEGVTWDQWLVRDIEMFWMTVVRNDVELSLPVSGVTRTIVYEEVSGAFD